MSGLPGGTRRLALLDEADFAAATTDPGAFGAGAKEAGGGKIALGPYAVARLETASA